MARQLTRSEVCRCIDRPAALLSPERAALPGVSAPRAAQSPAGVVVAHTVMKLTGVKDVTVCPWAAGSGSSAGDFRDRPGQLLP
ncbi:Ppx/GppA phosphatase [Actinobacteria bacterium OK074]|nr:Ppx/GppA phosphatase [Actinobacteria bacterium OK074]